MIMSDIKATDSIGRLCYLLHVNQTYIIIYLWTAVQEEMVQVQSPLLIFFGAFESLRNSASSRQWQSEL